MIIALGSNLGDRREHLRQAIAALKSQVHVTRTSPVYETPPWGYLEQPAFYNQVVCGITRLDPEGLLRFLKSIETGMGREKTITNGPRVIDLDILFYGEQVVEEAGLTIPHPRMRGRAFVLVPLADVAPDLRHPVNGMTVKELLEEADTSGIHAVEEGIDGGPQT